LFIYIIRVLKISNCALSKLYGSRYFLSVSGAPGIKPLRIVTLHSPLAAKPVNQIEGSKGNGEMRRILYDRKLLMKV
jgi:hypothetical protein